MIFKKVNKTFQDCCINVILHLTTIRSQKKVISIRNDFRQFPDPRVLHFYNNVNSNLQVKLVIKS